MNASSDQGNTDEVLAVYKRVNPSARPVESGRGWEELEASLRRRFLYEHRLPPDVFRGARVLDVGCGTGEKSVIFAMWGARVWGFDFNPDALVRARALARERGLDDRASFAAADVASLPVGANRRFQICVADGVLHHTPEPNTALRSLAERVAPGGWLVVRNYDPITAFQRLCKRAIVRIGTSGEAEMEASVRRFFADDVRRSVEVGGRSEEQAIYDNFINPRYVPLGREALDALRARGFRVYALHPSMDVPSLMGPPKGEPEDSLSWWPAALARSMVASDPAEKAIDEHGAELEECAAAARSLEACVRNAGVDAREWLTVLDAAVHYLAAARRALQAVATDAIEAIDGFADDIARLAREVDWTASAPPASLPPTEALFRGMSGLPMASWVLQRPPEGR